MAKKTATKTEKPVSKPEKSEAKPKTTAARTRKPATKKTIDKAAAEKSEKLATCEASLNDAKKRLSAASAELEIVEDATEYTATLETIRRTKAEVEFYSKQRV